ncbi:MAG TPA: hypothetical protein VHE61_01490 [Opitutaceae bacterium]|nr:hypothetical protein [Opitutaceae bacterium]
MKIRLRVASLGAMQVVAYREVERMLGRALSGFAATRQKLDPYERRVRERIGLMVLDVARARNRREREKATSGRKRVTR